MARKAIAMRRTIARRAGTYLYKAVEVLAANAVCTTHEVGGQRRGQLLPGVELYNKATRVDKETDEPAALAVELQVIEAAQ